MIPRSRKFHYIRSVNQKSNVNFEVKEFTCFCCYYQYKVPRECIFTTHVADQELITLEPYNADDVLCDKEYDNKA